MSLIPFEFPYEDEADDAWLSHLNVERIDNLNVIGWKYISDKICHTEDRIHPSLANITAHTPSFIDHSNFGFSIGMYSEFFIDVTYYPDYFADYVSFKVGSVSVSVGDMTPLAQYLYYGQWDHDFHPDMDELLSIRFMGALPHNIESLLLYVYIKLRKEYGFKFRLFNFSDPYDYHEEDEFSDEIQKQSVERVFQSHVKDVEPLRFYYKGLNDNDHSNAFLQFYRILEYYSIVQFHDNISELRWEKDLPTNKFIYEIQKIFYKDERGAICKLVSTIADSSVVARAFKTGLVDRQKIDVFSNALYDFRNSIVHAKYDQKTTILSESIFSPHSNVEKWREIIEEIAWKSLEVYGNRNT